MRILDVTGIYPNPAVDFEGRSVAALDRALVRHGAEVTVLVLKPWAPIFLARRIPRYRHLAVPAVTVDDHGVEVLFCRPPRIPRLPARWRYALNVRLAARHAHRRLRREGRRRFDLVHAQGLPTAVPAALLADRLGLPFAVTLRDNLAHLGAEGGHPLCRRVFEDAEVFFCIGPQQLRDAPRHLPAADPPPLQLAPNGLDFAEVDGVLDRLPPRPREFRGEILSVGNLYRLKGIHETLEALAALRDRGVGGWRYTVVGDGPYRSELKELASELGIADRVTFLGRLPHAEVLAHMRRADLFCLPSWMEAFGTVYAEAAATGLPSIGCLRNGAEILIEPEVTGLLVPPRDVPALADALAHLLADPEKTRRMGEAARRHVRRFTWERTAEIYLRTYAERLSERPPAARSPR